MKWTQSQNFYFTRHYVLFRDDSNAAARIGSRRITDSGIKVSYHEGCDTAAYVWRCVGKLTDGQAEYARGKLRMEFNKKLREEELEGMLDKETRRKLQIDVLRGDRPFQDYRRQLVMLLSLPTLMDLWQCKDYDALDPLRLAATVWKIEATDSLIAPPCSPEDEIRNFKVFLGKQKLTPFQKEVLNTCV